MAMLSVRRSLATAERKPRRLLLLLLLLVLWVESARDLAQPTRGSSCDLRTILLYRQTIRPRCRGRLAAGPMRLAALLVHFSAPPRSPGCCEAAHPSFLESGMQSAERGGYLLFLMLVLGSDRAAAGCSSYAPPAFLLAA